MFVRCQELDPESTAGLLGQAEVHKDLGNHREAIQLLQQAYDKDPKDHETAQELGRMHAHLERHQRSQTGRWYTTATGLAEGAESLSIRKEMEEVMQNGPENIDSVVTLYSIVL